MEGRPCYDEAMIRRPGLAAVALAASVPCAAQDWREPGTVYHVCRAEHVLPSTALAPPYSDPRLAVRGRDGRIEQRPLPARSNDSFTASAEVEADGTLRDVEMSWHRSAEAWPHQWRTDLYPLHVRATLLRELVPAGTSALFDPAALDLVIQFRSERRLRGPWLFHFLSASHGRGGAELMALGRPLVRGLELQIRWRVIEALAGGEERLRYLVTRPGFGAPAGQSEIDLSAMPAVLEGFESLAARLRAAIARAPEGCAREVEPEPPDEAFIAPAPAR